MSTKKKPEMEFRYYEIPQGERLLALLGNTWIRVYGNDTTDIKLHFHNLMEIGYCVSGDGNIVFGENVVPYDEGMLTVIPPNYPHTTNSRIHTKSHWEYLFVNPEELLSEFYPDNPLFAKKILDRINKKEQYYLKGENEQLVMIVRMIMDECRNRKSYSGEYIRGLLLTMLMGIARADKDIVSQQEHYQPHGGIYQISSALEYISKCYMENIKMETLAESCNLSETHFRRLFAENMNMTPSEYINLVRIQQACELMKKTRCSMEDVAARVGYTTISTFNRNFRKIIGTSPYQFKKSSENYQGKILDAKVSARRGW